jgi:hypothetical protein
MEAVGRVSPFTKSYLAKAHPVSLSQGVLVVGFDPEFASYVPLVDNPKNQALLQTKLKELGCGEVRVKFIAAKAVAVAEAVVAVNPAQSPPAEGAVGGAAAAAAPGGKPGAGVSGRAADGEGAGVKAGKAKPTRLDPADFKNDPLIREALEVFRGEIVEVRA